MEVAPQTPVFTPTVSTNAHFSRKESCASCRQGFFCSDHGSQIKTTQGAGAAAERKSNLVVTKKIVDINQSQLCKGKSFKEKDNHEAACFYHPGPPIFHDQKRGLCFSSHT